MNLTVIGPRSVGKSTVSKLLAKRLSYKHNESDELMNLEMKDHGGLVKSMNDKKDLLIMKRAVNVIERVLSKDKIILDLAGGTITHTKGTELGICKKIIEIITNNSKVIALLPFENNKESIEFLFKRERNRAHFIDAPSSELEEKVKKDYLRFETEIMDITKNIIYVGTKSPDEIVEEIIKQIL